MRNNMYKQAFSWEDFKNGLKNVGGKAKEFGNAAFQYAQENPWTAAGALALPVAGIVGLSSKRRNKLRNFLITLASVWGGGGLGMMAFNKWAPESWKLRGGMAAAPGTAGGEGNEDKQEGKAQEQVYQGPPITGIDPFLSPTVQNVIAAKAEQEAADNVQQSVNNQDINRQAIPAYFEDSPNYQAYPRKPYNPEVLNETDKANG